MPESSPQQPQVFLNPGGDRRVGRGHPWVYSNEIRMDAATKALVPGTLATLHRVDGKSLGIGMVNPHTLIAFRRLDRDAATVIDAAFLARRLQKAVELRDRLYDAPWYRLVHAEADALPGLVVDRFNDSVVVQANTAGMDRLAEPLLEALDRTVAPTCVVLRNDTSARALEGLEQTVQVIRGSIPEAGLTVREGSLTFRVDPVVGQKTGWFYDQRPSRAFAARLARGGRMLDLYAYAGGFGVAAAAAGAERVLGIDSSAPAVDAANGAARDNNVEGRCGFEKGDAFDALETASTAKERFRAVVADPPAFAKSKKEVPAALRGYRKLARLASAVVEPGGVLVIASCSHAVAADAFAAEVAIGVARADRTGRILNFAGAGPDHPVHPFLPESAYLKTLTMQLD